MPEGELPVGRLLDIAKASGTDDHCSIAVDVDDGDVR
jgi:hypothetical protein